MNKLSGIETSGTKMDGEPQTAAAAGEQTLILVNRQQQEEVEFSSDDVKSCEGLYNLFSNSLVKEKGRLEVDYSTEVLTKIAHFFKSQKNQPEYWQKEHLKGDFKTLDELTELYEFGREYDYKLFEEFAVERISDSEFLESIPEEELKASKEYAVIDCYIEGVAEPVIEPHHVVRRLVLYVVLQKAILSHNYELAAKAFHIFHANYKLEGLIEFLDVQLIQCRCLPFLVEKILEKCGVAEATNVWQRYYPQVFFEPIASQATQFDLQVARRVEEGLIQSEEGDARHSAKRRAITAAVFTSDGTCIFYALFRIAQKLEKPEDAQNLLGIVASENSRNRFVMRKCAISESFVCFKLLKTILFNFISLNKIDEAVVFYLLCKNTIIAIESTPNNVENQAIIEEATGKFVSEESCFWFGSMNHYLEFCMALKVRNEPLIPWPEIYKDFIQMNSAYEKESEDCSNFSANAGYRAQLQPIFAQIGDWFLKREESMKGQISVDVHRELMKIEELQISHMNLWAPKKPEPPLDCIYRKTLRCIQKGKPFRAVGKLGGQVSKNGSLVDRRERLQQFIVDVKKEIGWENAVDFCFLLGNKLGGFLLTSLLIAPDNSPEIIDAIAKKMQKKKIGLANVFLDEELFASLSSKDVKVADALFRAIWHSFFQHNRKDPSTRDYGIDKRLSKYCSSAVHIKEMIAISSEMLKKTRKGYVREILLTYMLIAQLKLVGEIDFSKMFDKRQSASVFTIVESALDLMESQVDTLEVSLMKKLMVYLLGLPDSPATTQEKAFRGLAKYWAKKVDLTGERLGEYQGHCSEKIEMDRALQECLKRLPSQEEFKLDLVLLLLKVLNLGHRDQIEYFNKWIRKAKPDWLIEFGAALQITPEQLEASTSHYAPDRKHAIAFGYYIRRIRQGEISAITAAMHLPSRFITGVLHGSELAILYSRNPLAAKPTVIKIEKDDEPENEKTEEKEKEVEHHGK